MVAAARVGHLDEVDVGIAAKLLVVARRGLVKIAHHVPCRLPGLGVYAVHHHMGLQLAQQGEHAVYTVVAGPQHVKRLLPAGNGPVLAWFRRHKHGRTVLKVRPAAKRLHHPG